MIISMERRAALVLAAAATVGSAHAGFILDNGPGNGAVSAEVDSFGSFGSGFANTAPTSPGPVNFQTIEGSSGDVGPASLVYVGVNQGARRVALTSGDFFGTGNRTPTPISEDNGSAVSSFTLETPGQPTLDIALRQSLEPLFSGTVRTGSVLVQTYMVTNTSTISSVAVDFSRYLDATLSFDGSPFDGGGLLNLQGDDYVFVTDAADTAAGSQATTFVGLTADNIGETGFVGSAYTVERTNVVRQRLRFGLGLDNIIYEDNDGDNFVDPAEATTDLALAFTSEYLLAPGATTNYMSRIIFGSGAPADVTPNPPVTPPAVPSPASLLLMLVGLLGMRKLRKPRHTSLQ